MPRHRIMDQADASLETRRKLQESLVLVHGGMAQNVGPILEMVTEKYLLRSEAEWRGRREAHHRQRVRNRRTRRLRPRGRRDAGNLRATRGETLMKKLDRKQMAARVARELVRELQARPLDEPTLLNVNVPNVPYEQLKARQVTRLGKRHKAEPVIKSSNPRGDIVYWVGAAGAAQDAGPGTDFHAVEQGAVSITPLQIDLTHYTQLTRLREWLSQ